LQLPLHVHGIGAPLFWCGGDERSLSEIGYAALQRCVKLLPLFGADVFACKRISGGGCGNLAG